MVTAVSQRKDSAVQLNQGDRVRVNVAPFIASQRRQRQSVPCEVVRVEGPRVLVVTRSPFRRIELWVDDCWIDRVASTVMY